MSEHEQTFQAPTPSPSSAPLPLRVVPLSPGLALGPVWLYRSPALQQQSQPQPTAADKGRRLTPEQVAEEQQRLRTAVEQAVAELQALTAQVARTVGKEEAAIFEAHQLILQDPEILDAAIERISQQGLPAEQALREVAEENAQILAALDDELLAARASDVRDATGRVLRLLSGTPASSLLPQAERVHEPVILVADDLTPSDTATLDPKLVAGICTVFGGPTTHAAIIARSLEIPAVSGLSPDLFAQLTPGQRIALDGGRGLLYLNLTPEQEREILQKIDLQQKERKEQQQQRERWRGRSGATADGVPVAIFANVGDEEGARQAAEQGAEGIGLLRTEFLFGGREQFPDEQEQEAAYRRLFRAFAAGQPQGKTIIARTLDAGADKPFPALEALIGSLQEANPALGLRGARIHLCHEELLRQQLRALLRAAQATGITLQIMFPMIATLEEVRRLRALTEEVLAELEGQGLRLTPRPAVGIMVETPAAALMADVLARAVDFFSIGTNDLYQYVMAVDRTNGRVASLFGRLEPAVWRAIAQVARAGQQHGRLVAVCGELAGDPLIGPLLVGLGVRELSMNPPALLAVKERLARQPLAYWQEQAQRLLQAETAAELQHMLESIA
ncbi:MAG: phosphoenolpyruvate--protein phosphotransferase [Thermogemmatispora sp.]|uniref:phosphoenolpyruvate--protein phosphotransferase n=1 Tax=Thermogemmatispora sp. TaxID=1968838 RepID=UPI00261F5DEC|nr:phosphoenolpyruvate--protein phosphotransferase [Thermogemmatispora sp.]MBX5455847.1 phosphoenolpyruvate--protein phosphotransferase [Thermogemmatispora sp.]